MKKALIFGFNRYESQPSLRGCVADAQEFQDVVANVLGYQTELVVDRSITCDAFLAAARRHLTPEPGEVAGSRILYFAGHGSRTYDKPPLDEGDGIDELLCLPSSHFNDPQSMVLDDQIGALLDDAAANDPTMRVFVVFDSCHSGTGIRGSTTWKVLEPELLAHFAIDNLIDLPLTSDDPRIALAVIGREAIESNFTLAHAEAMAPEFGVKDGGLLGVVRGGAAPHLLLSGCAANETCKETVVSKAYRGLFTANLCELIRARPNQSWAELHDSVSGAIPAHFNQRPQLEGTDQINATSISD